MYERDEGSKNSREEIRTEIVPKKENAAADQYGNKIIIKKNLSSHQDNFQEKTKGESPSILCICHSNTNRKNKLSI